MIFFFLLNMSISSYGRLLLLMAKRIHRKKIWVKGHLICIIMAAILDFLRYVGYGFFQYLKLILFKVSLHLLVLKDHQNVIIELF